MNFPLRKDLGFLAALLGLSALLYGFNLGGFGLLDPDEPFYSLTAKEMVQRGDPSTPVIFAHPQFEKPIFFYWVVYAAFSLFGVHEWSARLGPCLGGILLVLAAYFWGRVLFRRPEIAFAGAAILATAAEHVVLSRIVLTDVFLGLFVTASLAAFSAGYFHARHRTLAWNLVFFFAGLGFLTKGLLGALLPGMAIAVFLTATGELALLRRFPWLTGGLLFAAVGLPWYALMTAKFGPDFLTHFFIHENVRRFFVAEHARFDRFYFYPGGFLAGFFPWTFALPFALAYAVSRARVSEEGRPLLLLSAAFISFFVFFAFAKSKLLSYIFPAFPVAALMMGRWGYAAYRSLRAGGRPSPVFLGTASAVLGVVPAVLAAGVLIYGKRQGLDLAWGVAVFTLSAVPLYLAAAACLWRRKALPAFFCVLAATAAFSCAAFGLVLPVADDSFASREVVEDYQPFRSEAGGLMVGSKILVRGVSYYSGNSGMALITDNPKHEFYTNHSIPVISSRQDLESLPGASFPAYFFMQPKQFKFLQKIADEKFRVTVLEKTPQKVFARVERIG